MSLVEPGTAQLSTPQSLSPGAAGGAVICHLDMKCKMVSLWPALSYSFCMVEEHLFFHPKKFCTPKFLELNCHLRLFLDIRQ